jgi:hypothetical protein
MAYTQADLDSIRAAIISGALSVRYADGRSVNYRSLDELRNIAREIEAELGAVSPTRPRVTFVSLNRD